MRDRGDRHYGDGWLMQRYTRLLDWSVHHRLAAVAIGTGILAVSVASTTFLSFGFMPGEDANRILIAAELPPGSRLADMDKAGSEISKIAARHAEVTNVFVIGGRILAVAGGGEEVRKATLIVNLTDKAKRNLTQRQLEQAISAELQQLPDVRTWILKDNGERDASFVVSGPDNAAVTQTAARIASQMQQVPDLAHVVTNSALDRPELRFRPRPGVAAELGVSTEALSEAIRIATIGDISANLPKFNAGNRQVPIRVQLDEAARSDPRILESLKVMTAAGVAVPLVSVAAVEMGQGPSSIERFDRQRRVMITADLNGTDALARAVNAVLELPAAKEKPEGVTFKVAGDAEIMGEVFASFGLAMAAGVLMVYGVLVLLFGSFMQPVTILASLPFTIGGVIIALLVTGRPMSMPVIIGMLMLMGIVTKNAIMLVDFAIEEIARGVPRYVAIVDAGRKRARPIVMTTIAMVGGMLPSALAMGAGGEFRSPMAIAVMGGLIVSTMLSLVFVPAVFIVVDDLANFLWRGFGRFVGEADEEPANDNIVIRRALPAANRIEVPAEAAE